LAWLESAAVVDAEGRVLVDSEGKWTGQPAAQTPFRNAAKLARTGSGATILRSEDRARFVGAYPVAGTGAWVLLLCDRSEAVAAARTDAHRQLRWIAGAVAGLCVLLSIVLDFGWTRRFARLVDAVRGFGEGRSEQIPPMRGSDEIAHLSATFAAMAA